jgi:hypothetical protein
MGPVVDKEKENDENAPKILCRMDHHYCISIKLISKNKINKYSFIYFNSMRQCG